ncbi:MAG: hypothetical protein CVV64_19535 [Candidatus Wallbacteria bacterium HGW-Wallbacteria-1]|jgi:hypothetical protein|uniref:NodB homology domain-containing protein n=1 Tax=Candidatus Wallbacteria bacterium HGW-Wallbacteria-1 TaxID=2013854 RepID=A0A2N1PIU2_9BACT|nr:MAG: hypothetical protein CVV64_19535 [Candidatus Wallbacteria bacterium HGW-Wallbacteria-1]
MDTSKPRLYFICCCDTDPDHVIDYRSVAPSAANWNGVTQGIPLFRHALSKAIPELQNMKVTWLIRSDRQIAEAYNDPAFAYTFFSKIWDTEAKLGSELGWHPHLFKWSPDGDSKKWWAARGNPWQPFLNSGDDTDFLRLCHTALSAHFLIDSVRMGWDYGSSNLVKLFQDLSIKCDASPFPGCAEKGAWQHDWLKTFPEPYCPSHRDYRIPENPDDKTCVCKKTHSGIGRPNPESELLMFPSLVRPLNPVLSLSRWFLKMAKNIGRRKFESPPWAKYQGVSLTFANSPFMEALNYQFDYILNSKSKVRPDNSRNIFMTSFFHTPELIRPPLLRNFMKNLKSIRTFAVSKGMEAEFITLREFHALYSQTTRNDTE